LNQPNNTKVAIITMSFPYNRETFAINEFLYLKNYCELSIHSLRPKHKIADRLIRDYGLQHIVLSHYSIKTLIKFPYLVFRHFSPFLFLLKYIFSVKFGRISYFFKSLVFVPVVLELFAEFKKNPPDVIHTYWCHFPALVTVLCEKYLKHIRFTINYTAHDIYLNYNIINSATVVCEKHFTICEENIPYIKSLGVADEDIEVVYRGVPKKCMEYRSKPKKPFSILSVGTMIPLKSFDAVMEVYRQLKVAYPTASLIIGGDGPERDNLEQLSKELGVEEVIFTGYLMHDEVLKLMNEADVFLLMSKNERIANVTKEAMLMECFCVATRTPGVDELIDSEANGFLIDIDDIEAAVATIRRIWANKDKYEHIRFEGKKTIEDKFILEKNIHKYLKVWNN